MLFQVSSSDCFEMPTEGRLHKCVCRHFALMWWALLHRGRSERFCVEHRGLQKTLAEEAVSNADAKSENSEVPLRSMSCNLMPTPMISDNPDLVTQREASGKLSFL